MGGREMKGDLISRSALRKTLEMRNMTVLYPEWRTLSLGMREKILRLAGAFRNAIDTAPVVDAVPVVRCMECRYRQSTTCPMHYIETCLDDLDGYDEHAVDRTADDGYCEIGRKHNAQTD